MLESAPELNRLNQGLQLIKEVSDIFFKEIFKKKLKKAKAISEKIWLTKESARKKKQAISL